MKSLFTVHHNYESWLKSAFARTKLSDAPKQHVATARELPSHKGGKRGKLEYALFRIECLSDDKTVCASVWTDSTAFHLLDPKDALFRLLNSAGESKCM